MTLAYGEDLAYIHDAGFGHTAQNAAPVLLRLLRRSGKKGGLVVDLGCGSGILARELADAGYEVMGIDLSPAMIALAQRRVPDGKFYQGSFVTADIPPCVGVCAVGEILNYLFDRANTQQSLGRVFHRVFRALEPGSVFLCDVAEPGRVPGGALRSYREGDDWAVLFSAQEDRRRRLLTRDITCFRRVGDLYRRDHEVHRLRLYQRSELRRQLERVGFTARTLTRYGKQRFPPGYVAFAARRSP